MDKWIFSPISCLSIMLSISNAELPFSVYVIYIVTKSPYTIWKFGIAKQMVMTAGVVVSVSIWLKATEYVCLISPMNQWAISVMDVAYSDPSLYIKNKIHMF